MTARVKTYRPVSPWPVLIVVLPEIFTAWVVLSANPQFTPVYFLRVSLPIYAVTLAAILAAMWAIRRYLPTPRSFLQWAGQYALAIVAPAAVGAYLMAPFVDSLQRHLIIVFLVVCTRLFNILLLAYIIDDILVQWRSARVSARRLSETLHRVSGMNVKLHNAERSLFTLQARVIRQRVLVPLHSLAHRAPWLTNEELADRVDRLISETMRPLAHRMHPVTLSVGLATSLQALTENVDVRVDSAVAALDASGELLDPGVRLQVYRWVRLQLREIDHARIDMRIEGRQLLVTTTGRGLAPDIDPMMAVAGLEQRPTESEFEHRIAAPLKGQFVDQLEASVGAEADGPTAPIAHATFASAFTLGADHKMAWTAVIAVLSLPGTVLVATLRGSSLAILMSGAWLLVPILVAGLLALVPVKTNSRWSALWVVATWIIIGAFAGIAEVVTYDLIDLVTGNAEELELNFGFNLMRGVVRFALAGILITGARGAARQAQLNNDLLTFNLDGALAERVRLLNESDRVERFVAEKLHRAIQGRLSAISLLLRLGQRDRALDELDVLRYSTVPALAASMGSAWNPSESFIDERDLPPDLSIVEAIDSRLVRDLDEGASLDLRTFAAECAVNARRHGKASTVTVSLQPDAESAVLTCSDDGRGMAGGTARGLGTALFDEVAARLHGSWRFIEANDGTTVRLVFPKPGAGA